MNVDIEHLRSWIGRTETLSDVATLAPLRGLSATLDRDDAPPAAEIVARLKAEYDAARAALFAGETVPTRLKQAAE